MAKPLLLDLFCGEGGASRGYADAGFDVIGVDMSAKRLESYPYEGHEGDAIQFLLAHGHHFAAIHASPPCTGYSRGTTAIPDRLERYDRLIAATREALRMVGRPYVIENVEDARPHLRSPIRLCGSMFGLRVQRHRLFESPCFDRDPWMFATPPCAHGSFPGGSPIGVYGSWGDDIPGGGTTASTIEEAREAMGIDWMGWRSRTQEWGDLKEAVPPAYTEWIGSRLLTVLAPH